MYKSLIIAVFYHKDTLDIHNEWTSWKLSSIIGVKTGLLKGGSCRKPTSGPSCSCSDYGRPLAPPQPAAEWLLLFLRVSPRWIKTSCELFAVDGKKHFFKPCWPPMQKVLLVFLAQAWKLAQNHYRLISLKLRYHVIDIFLVLLLFTKLVYLIWLRRYHTLKLAILGILHWR